MASQNDYLKPRNKELRDLTWNLPHPLRVCSPDGKVLWENRVASELEEELEWESSPTTWQNKKAVLQTAVAEFDAQGAQRSEELEDEVAGLRKHQRQTARKKRQAEAALEKAKKKFEADKKKLQQKLEKAKAAKQAAPSDKPDPKLAKLEKLTTTLELEAESLKKELKRAREESDRRLEDVERLRKESAAQGEALFKASEKISELEEAVQSVSASDDQGGADLQPEVQKLKEDKATLESWVEELETKLKLAEEKMTAHETALADTVAAFEAYRKQVDQENEEREADQLLAAKIAEFEALERTLEEEQRAFDQEKSALQEQLQAQEQEVEKLKAGLSGEKEPDLADLEDELADTKADLELARRKEARLTQKLETLEELRGEHSKVLEMLKDDLEESRERERELKSTVKLYAESHKEMNGIKDESKELRKKVEELQATEAQLREQLKSEQLLKSAAKDPGSEETISISVKNQIDFLKKRLASTEKELDESREVIRKEKAQNQSSKEAEKLAFQDTLTGLPNANMVNRYLDYAHKNAKENGRAVGLFVIDISGFRLLNKTYGKATGDKLLKAVGERLNSMRGSSHLVARRHQDQFLLLAADIEKSTVSGFVQQASKSLLEALAYPFEVDGEQIKLTGSIGAAIGPLEGEHSLELHANAEAALETAKRLGVSKFSLFDEKHRANLQRESTYAKQMSHAVGKDEFQAVFQPVFHLTKGIVLGLELLLRWEHRDQRTLYPAEFLESAVKTGLIFDITAHIWPKAFREFSKWRKMRPGLTLSINLSDRELINPQVLKNAIDLTKEHSIDPKTIIFEVRDQSRLRMSPVWWTLLQSYTAAGFGLCLDDFASDSSLFGTLAYSGFRQAKMRLDSAKGLKLVTAPQAAKGVEYGIKHVQGKFDKKSLAKAGFHLAQGFAVSEPLDYADVDMVLS